MKITLDSTESPADEDLAFVRKNLRAYNRAAAGTHMKQNLAVFARDDGGIIVGGATGEVMWGWLYVDLLWVEESHRGRGIGRSLLTQIETMAKQYNVFGFHLGTTDFQALDFYLANGYEVWGQLADFPPGHTNYALRKLNED